MSDNDELVLEWLHHDECVALLSTAELGRLGVVEESEPLVIPVNFSYTDGSVLIHTDEGTKLSAANYGRAALEADDIDPVTHQGWSVLVRGRAYDISEAVDDRSERLRQVPNRSWAPGPKGHLLVIHPEHVTGRRLRPRRHQEERPPNV